MDLSQFDLARIKEVAGVVESVAKIVALVVGALWAYMLFVSKRQIYPRAEISHEVSHRPITQDNVLLNVALKIMNKGDVLLQIVHADTQLQHLRPLPMKMGEELTAQHDLVVEGELAIRWPLRSHRITSWEKGQFEIEPGESDHIYYDFVVSQRTETIRLYTYIANARKGPGLIRSTLRPFARLYAYIRGAKWEDPSMRGLGWSCATVYDIERKDDKKTVSAAPSAESATTERTGGTYPIRWLLSLARRGSGEQATTADRSEAATTAAASRRLVQRSR